MATAEAMAPLAAQHPAFEKVEVDLTDKTPSKTALVFDATTHLAFEPPKEFITLKDLLLSEDKAISPIAVTAPFPLFSIEGVKEMRRDLFRKDVIDKHAYSTTPGCYKMRGYSKDTPFVDSVWRDPKVLEACSKAAGVDLSVVYDYEIAHMNVQVGGIGGGDSLSSVLPPATPPRSVRTYPESSADKPAIVQDDDLESLPSNGTWHNDSYPWVCVVMLSDPTNMTGGETGLRKGDGTLLRVRGPGIGWAVMMQGGCVNHIALKAAEGTSERITMVTSFRAKDPLAKDISNLRNVKRSSRCNELFEQWSKYRLDVLAERATIMKRQIEEGRMSAAEIGEAMARWNDVQSEYMKVTVSEMFGEGREGSQY